MRSVEIRDRISVRVYSSTLSYLYFFTDRCYIYMDASDCGGERIRRGWKKYGKRAEVPSTS